MDQENLLNFLNDLNSLAIKKGATECDSVVIDDTSNQLVIRKGKLDQAEYSRSKSFGLRVFVGKKQAIVSSTDFSLENLENLAEKAVSIAKASPEDPYLKIASPLEINKEKIDLDLYDDTSLSFEQMLQMATIAEDTALSIPGITNSEGSEVSQTKSFFALSSSNGFTGAFSSSRFSNSIAVIAESENGMEVDYDYSIKRYASELKSPESIGKKAAELALKKLNSRKLSTLEAPVIYIPRVASSLIGEFVSAINGNSIARKTSFLKDMLGQKIFNDSINIVDDPRIKRGQRSRVFDAECLPTKKMNIVEKGELKSFLLDLRSAGQLNLEATGHATRGISSAPYPSHSNLYVENGQNNEEEFIKSMKRGLIITSLFGGGVNLLTGDYSQGASGLWVENGEIVYPVSEVTIASNLKDIFKLMLPANNLEMEYSINSPSIFIEKMTIAGA